MKPPKRQQILPALIMAGAAAIPAVTTVEILTHVPGTGSTAALQPSGPVAVAPSKASSRAAGSPAPTSSGGTQTYQGPVVNQPYGGVQASITIAGKKISNVAISAPQDNPRSAAINQQAVPLLQSETLQAQSAQVNTVSGATFTSQAYAQSLQAALDQARSQGNAPRGTTSSSQSGTGTSPSIAQAPSVSVGGDD
jgi:uncharacterized protein with FMN-binding domain